MGNLVAMTFDEQVKALRTMADELVKILRNAGLPLNVDEALRQAARALTVAVSEMRFALSYAASRKMVRIDRISDTLQAA
ncbi:MULTISPECIES: hypothetical protein [unclassified Frondihabitans]|uniref:hypothetical protein n=1 Tax=unclassified Frondihabitans TaxID=2626248 RepID=UPI000F4D4434|nr:MULTISPECIES: hypothetical protein [unclassified Frondihabitans]